jgi:hypothetical protein
MCLIKKVRGLFVRKQGSVHETGGLRVDSYKAEGFFRKTVVRRGTGFPQPSNPRSAAQIRSAGERAGASGRAWMIAGAGVSAT